MNDKRADLNLLAVFEAVAATGSVTAAAARLSLSQPAVSHALNRLRDLTGDALFVRSGNRLILTRHGEAMYPLAREAVASARLALRPAGFDPATTTASFRIGASDYAMMTVAPDLVRALRLRAPGAALDITPVGASCLIDLTEGRLDLAFWGAQPPSPPFHARELFRERFIGLVCARHPLAIRAGQGRLDLDDYLAHPHAIVSFRDPRRSPIDLALSRLGRTRRIGLTAPSFAGNVAALRGTDLILSLPSRLAPLSEGGGLVRFELPLDVPDYPYSMIWHARGEEDRALLWLRELIADAVGRRGREPA